MNYDDLIDPETWAFIRDTEAYYPPDTATRPIADQRAIYDRMCRAFFKGYPEGVAAHDIVANGVPCRIYECNTSEVTLVYFHGGGFVVGGLESHDDICAEICSKTGSRVVAVDYRLSPENTHPAAFDDALNATLYVALTWPNRILLAGDSAGANLAACVAHKLRGQVEIAGQILIYPGLGGDTNRGSYIRHANAPMLTLDEVKFYTRMRHGDQTPAPDPTAAPLHDTTFADLPPTVIVGAQCDPLADDGRSYRDAIRDAGGLAYYREEEGLVHGYLRGRSTVTRAKISFDWILRSISDLGKGDWPF